MDRKCWTHSMREFLSDAAFAARCRRMTKRAGPSPLRSVRQTPQPRASLEALQACAWMQSEIRPDVTRWPEFDEISIRQAAGSWIAQGPLCRARAGGPEKTRPSAL